MKKMTVVTEEICILCQYGLVCAVSLLFESMPTCVEVRFMRTFGCPGHGLMKQGMKKTNMRPPQPSHKQSSV